MKEKKEKEHKKGEGGEDTMEKIVALCKRRGFVYPGSDIYGGLANSWDFGPLGVELKRNIKDLWWKVVTQRDDMYGLDAAIIMNRKVWQASGHEQKFNDPLVECKKCHQRFREDKIEGEKCPDCGGALMEARQFNTMFKTHVGVLESDDNIAYLRPETAQGIFVNFKNIIDTMAPKLPFGIAQIGKAFRNEITPGNFIFRTREFEQMEIEYFIHPQDDWNKRFEYWLESMKGFMEHIGIDMKKVSYHEIPDGERAHYSKRTIDVEFEFPFGKDELFGLAYRGDFDLKVHQEESKETLGYFDEETKKRILPHVIEPSLGLERMILALLVSAYTQDEIDGESRTYLNFVPRVAPYKVAVFPLLANKPDLIEEAKRIREMLRSAEIGPVAWDARGNIGKRYRAQDEIGTPYCITVDFDSLGENSVTVRDRNTTQQTRIATQDLVKFLEEKLK